MCKHELSQSTATKANKCVYTVFWVGWSNRKRGKTSTSMSDGWCVEKEEKNVRRRYQGMWILFLSHKPCHMEEEIMILFFYNLHTTHSRSHHSIIMNLEVTKRGTNFFLLSYTTSIVVIIVYIAILSLCKEWDLAHYLYLLTSVSYTIRWCIFEIIIMLRNYFNLHNFRCKTWKCLAGKFLP